MGKNKTAITALFLIFIVIFGVFFYKTYFKKVEGRRDIPATSLFISPADPNIIYAGTDGLGVLKSSDGGESWASINSGLKIPFIRFVTGDPSNPSILYAGTHGGGIYKSDDGGRSWREVNKGLTNNTVIDLVFDPADPDTIYLLTEYGGIFKSTNRGMSWVSYSKGLQHMDTDAFQDMMYVPSSPPALLVGRQEGLYQATPGNGEWVKKREFEGMFIGAFAYDNQKEILFTTVGAFGQLYKSHDKGLTWSPSGKPAGNVIKSLIVDPRTSTLIAGIYNLGVLKSFDEGNSWEAINRGLPSKEIKTLAIDPRNPDHLYAALHGGGVYKSEDRGGVWRPMNKGVVGVQESSIPLASKAPHVTSQGVSVPGAFDKCNVCHGWIDPVLNFRDHVWLVAWTPRDWEYTVKRMMAIYQRGGNPLDVLTPEEEKSVIKFMDAHYGIESAGKNP